MTKKRVRIVVRLAESLLKRRNPPGLKYVPEFPGQPTPARPAETPKADPVTAILDEKLPRVGGA